MKADGVGLSAAEAMVLRAMIGGRGFRGAGRGSRFRIQGQSFVGWLRVLRNEIGGVGNFDFFSLR